MILLHSNSPHGGYELLGVLADATLVLSFALVQYTESSDSSLECVYGLPTGIIFILLASCSWCIVTCLSFFTPHTTGDACGDEHLALRSSSPCHTSCGINVLATGTSSNHQLLAQFVTFGFSCLSYGFFKRLSGGGRPECCWLHLEKMYPCVHQVIIC